MGSLLETGIALCESYSPALVVGSSEMTSNWQPGGSIRTIDIPGFSPHGEGFGRVSEPQISKLPGAGLQSKQGI